jgi:hypothetical protein
VRVSSFQVSARLMIRECAGGVVLAHARAAAECTSVVGLKDVSTICERPRQPPRAISTFAHVSTSLLVLPASDNKASLTYSNNHYSYCLLSSKLERSCSRPNARMRATRRGIGAGWSNCSMQLRAAHVQDLGGPQPACVSQPRKLVHSRTYCGPDRLLLRCSFVTRFTTAES